MPKVSICIPAYGQPLFLRRALESIFIQKYKDHEIIVTDDSTDDNVEKVMNDYAGYSNLRYYKNKDRKGSPENWNETIRFASGEYIKLLHHDDWFADENSLDQFVDMLEQNPQANFAFCSSLNFCSMLVDSRLEQKLSFIHTPTEMEIRQLRLDPTVLFFRNFVGAPSATIYRKKANHQFDPRLKWVVDFDFYIRVLAENKSFGFSFKPLICVTSEAINHVKVTNECVGNKFVEVFEWLYLYNKLAKHYGVNYQRLKLVGKICERHKIWTLQDLLDCGIDFPIPQHIILFLWYRKILPLEMMRRFKRFIAANFRKLPGHKQNKEPN